MHHEGGKNPVWNESFDIDIQTPSDTIKFTCLDEDLIQNDLIGESSVLIHAIGQKFLKRHILPMYYKGNHSADLTLETKCVINNM